MSSVFKSAITNSKTRNLLFSRISNLRGYVVGSRDLFGENQLQAFDQIQKPFGKIDGETDNSEEQIDPIYLEPQRIPRKYNITHFTFQSHVQKSQENFERKTHKRLLTLKDANKNIIDKLLLYLTKNCPPGIGMRVTRWEWEELGVGKRMLENVKTKEESRMYSDVEKKFVDDGDKKILSVGSIADILIKGMKKDLSMDDNLKKSLEDEINSKPKDKMEITKRS
ncbi:ribosomal protein S10 [Rhizophagus clarus]|uniref:Ribosomal protein S10 n=1 Tax=Rhizophagus clarus TaxID=94130 RepID=A0A8H3L012_9GLOM|nr:ribosomal protein S10 [Rhizophagus clarus]